MNEEKKEGALIHIISYIKKHKELTEGLAAPLFSFQEKRKILDTISKKIPDYTFQKIFNAEVEEILQIRIGIHRVLNNMQSSKEKDLLLAPLAYKYGSYLEQCIEDHILEKELEKVDEIVAEFSRGRPRISVGYEVIDESRDELVDTIDDILIADNIPAIIDDIDDFNDQLDKDVKYWEEEVKKEPHIRNCLLEDTYGYRLMPRCIASVDIAGRGRIMYNVMDYIEEKLQDSITFTAALSGTFLDEWIQKHPEKYEEIRLEKAAQHIHQKKLDTWR